MKAATISTVQEIPHFQQTQYSLPHSRILASQLNMKAENPSP